MCFRRKPCPSSAAASGSNTVATLALAPGSAWIGWKPRSRDVKNEKPVFYAEFSQLYIPSAGVVEGVHQVSIRPAQGELGELIFDVPAGATITDVTDASAPAPQAITENLQNRQSSIGNRQSIVSLWRFDPDARKLRVTLEPGAVAAVCAGHPLASGHRHAAVRRSASV